MIGATFAGLSVMLAFSGAHQFGVHRAEAAAAGRPVELSLIGISVPGLEAHPEMVRVLSETTSARCLVRLGEADGLVVFFDPAAKMTVRLPADVLEADEVTQKSGCR